MKLIIVMILGVVASGCSNSVVKETTYNMMSNIGQQQCEKETLSDCPQQQNYDDYQRQRKEEVQ